MEPVIIQETDQSNHETCLATEKTYTDPYDEEECEQKFLLSKPTCFIIIGKPGSGKTTLAQRFAQHWRCEFLNVQTLVSEMLRSTDEKSNALWQILCRGELLPEDLAFQLLETKLHSPEVRHHGYILDDYPTISEDFMNIQDQFERMKTWKLTPDFIINLKIPDEDLITRRTFQRIDPQTGTIYTEEVYNASKRPKKESKPEEENNETAETEDEDAEDKEDEEAGETELSAEIVKSLLTRPEDLLEQTNQSIQKYKSNMLRILEEYMMDHNRNRVIELDANQPVEILIQQIITKLQLLGLSPAAVLQRLHDDEEEEMVEETDPEEVLKTYSTKKIVSTAYPWKRSRWGKLCPVALYGGNMKPGKAEFAVSFLDKIYLLSSMESMDKFLRNPRPYLLRPNPKPTCKISVLGLPKSGKTSLCYLLAEKYKAKVIQVKEKIDEEKNLRKEEKLKSWMQECTKIAIETVRNNIKKRLVQEFISKKTTAKLSIIEEEKPVNEPEVTEDTETKEIPEAIPEEDESLEDTKLTPVDKPKIVVEDIDKGDDSVLIELNPILKTEVEETIATIDDGHPEVCELIGELMKTRGKPNITMSAEEQFNILQECVSKTEQENQLNKNGGWILDGFPFNSDVWQACADKNWLPDNLICLVDESRDYDWLMKDWLKYQPDTESEVTTPEIEKVEKIEEVEKVEKVEGTVETELTVEKSGVDNVEGEEGEETTPKEEELQPTEATSKLLVEEGSGEVAKESPQQIEPTETTEIEPPKNVEIVDKIKAKIQTKEALLYKELIKKNASVLNNCMITVTGNTTLDPFSIEINDCQIEDIFQKAVAEIEKPFNYSPLKYSLMEMEEDDEQIEDEEQDEEENEKIEEEEEEENVHHSRKRALGNTSYFCPVVLQEKGLLCPGKPENVAKFANKLCYMSSADALDQFLMSSSTFLPKDKPPNPPAIRLCIIGVHGSGKTIYGRYLARKLGIFHICFHERLQELILKKTKTKVGPHYGDAGSEMSSDDSDNEDDNTDSETLSVSDSGSDYGELTEEEESIKANLEGEGVLPVEIMESILNPWWFNEPFRSTGFILEGFPRNADEISTLQEIGLWFDAAIILNVEDSDVVARLLPPKLANWKIKKDKKLEHMKKKKEKAKKEKELKIKKRREELMKELEEKKRAKLEKLRKEEEAREKDAGDAKEGETERDENEENEKGEDVQPDEPPEEEEEEEEIDIEMILLEEFQDEEDEEGMFEIEEQSEEDAYDKIFGDITEQYEIESSKLGNVQENLEHAAIPYFVVEAGRRQPIVNYILNRSLRPYVDYRESIFERVFPVSESLARQLLNIGYKQSSCLGVWCPISLQENLSMQSISSGRSERYPCVYRQYIYFLSSPEARDRFIKNPLSFLKRNLKPRPLVPLKLAIIGPPKSGKTYLCNMFSEKYGAERLSLGVVTRRILETQPNTHLSLKILSYLCKGLLLPDELAIEALEVVLLNAKCQTKGYVLDGVPFTKHQAELMTARKIIPTKVIWLDIESTEVVHRGAFDRLNLPRPHMRHDSGQVVALRYQVFQREIKSVVEVYERDHQNLVKVNGKQSKWLVWEEVKAIALHNISEIQNYLSNMKQDKAASLRGMCVTHKDFIDHLGDFDQFCPVSLNLNDELVDCSADSSMDLVAEFRGYYYKMASKENLQLFLDEPEKFVPPNAPRTLPPPHLLPKRLSSSLDDMEMALMGYCPVTFLDGKCRYESIIPGQSSFLVKYKDQCYTFATEENLDKFMRRPEKYSHCELPHKLPPKIDPMEILQLPHLGFMEQTVATPLLRALVAVGNFKPKFPFLNATHSARLYVAYHLKAFNPRNSRYIRKKYQEKLKRFEEDCELIGYLSKNMDLKFGRVGSSEEFNNKMDTFFALKGFEPSLTWIAR